MTYLVPVFLIKGNSYCHYCLAILIHHITLSNKNNKNVGRFLFFMKNQQTKLKYAIFSHFCEWNNFLQQINYKLIFHILIVSYVVIYHAKSHIWDLWWF